MRNLVSDFFSGVIRFAFEWLEMQCILTRLPVEPPLGRSLIRSSGAAEFGLDGNGDNGTVVDWDDGWMLRLRLETRTRRRRS